MSDEGDLRLTTKVQELVVAPGTPWGTGVPDTRSLHLSVCDCASFGASKAPFEILTYDGIQYLYSRSHVAETLVLVLVLLDGIMTCNILYVYKRYRC
jgi:hypothetical protein